MVTGRLALSRYRGQAPEFVVVPSSRVCSGAGAQGTGFSARQLRANRQLRATPGKRIEARPTACLDLANRPRQGRGTFWLNITVGVVTAERR